MEGFQINYTDLSDLFWEYKRKIENLIENIDNCIERINMFTENGNSNLRIGLQLAARERIEKKKTAKTNLEVTVPACDVAIFKMEE